jgi:hypothetical protein
MTYTINGNEYTELGINKRCAEIEGIKFMSDDVEIMVIDHLQSLISGDDEFEVYDPCTDWTDASHIIDKCWDELMKLTETFDDGTADGLCTRWEYLMNYDNCTKLVAACICYIEINEAAL